MGRRSPEELLSEVKEKIDLTQYEVEGYLAVLEHGTVTATELAKVTEIPQPRIYDILRKLNKRNLIDLQETRPMKAVALEPNGSFRSVQESMSTLLAELQHQYTIPDRDEEDAYLVRSQNSIQRRIRKLIEAAQFELILSLTPNLMDMFTDELMDAQNRNVSTELVVSPVSDAPLSREYPYGRIASEVKGREGLSSPVLTVSDGANAIYTSREAFHDNDPDRYGMVFNNSELGSLVNTFYETMLWPTCTETLYVADREINLPAQYASVRRCIQHIDQLRSPVAIQVEGKYVDTNQPADVQGVVTDTRLSDDLSVASIVIEDQLGDTVTIGGRAAAFEDIEAHKLMISEPE